MRSQSLRAHGVCWVMLAVACSQFDDHLSVAEVVGRYQLVSVGGNSLPVDLPLPPSPPRITLSVDTLWLRADGTFEEHMMRAAIGPPNLLIIAGEFRLIGATVQLTQTGGTPATGTFLGPRLTVGTAADAYVYQRRCSGDAC
jgi:hypothetical protein